MGRFDDITPDQLRADLRHFADLIAKLDADGTLLDAAPRLLKVLGDLRAKIFAYEVRFTGRLSPRPEPEPNHISDSQRIVEDAIRRSHDALGEWKRSPDAEHD
jgi:hypothetical protein